MWCRKNSNLNTIRSHLEFKNTNIICIKNEMIMLSFSHSYRYDIPTHQTCVYPEFLFIYFLLFYKCYIHSMKSNHFDLDRHLVCQASFSSSARNEIYTHGVKISKTWMLLLFAGGFYDCNRLCLKGREPKEKIKHIFIVFIVLTEVFKPKWIIIAISLLYLTFSWLTSECNYVVQ